ncbi:MAG: tetratricopeptide repeat protein, partial [Proteobacteria bacterium]|nr:tetratricopeptide repeat protein [Pseudomonadota bacterium]
MVKEEIEQLLLQAKTSMIEGDLEASLKSFNEVLKLEPENPVALLSIATALFKLKEYDESINLFTRFIAEHPGNSKAYCGRGNALLAKDENEKAMTDFCKSIELNPHYA